VGGKVRLRMVRSRTGPWGFAPVQTREKDTIGCSNTMCATEDASARCDGTDLRRRALHVQCKANREVASGSVIFSLHLPASLVYCEEVRGNEPWASVADM
jgi:hypothetical protein